MLGTKDIDTVNVRSFWVCFAGFEMLLASIALTRVLELLLGRINHALKAPLTVHRAFDG